jgi:hypothetical protein
MLAVTIPAGQGYQDQKDDFIHLLPEISIDVGTLLSLQPCIYQQANDKKPLMHRMDA